MRRPPITITCECGEARQVPYGERWTCERCGRHWNTQQIPAAEYDGLLRSMRRVRLQVLVVALLLAAVFVPLIVFVDSRFLFLAPMAAIFWVVLYVPIWRRKVRRAAQNAPRWELHPE